MVCNYYLEIVELAFVRHNCNPVHRLLVEPGNSLHLAMVCKLVVVVQPH